MGATQTKRPVASVTVAKFTDSDRPLTVMRDKQKLSQFGVCGPDDYRAQGMNTPLRDATAQFIRRLDALQRKNRVVIGLLADESGSMAGRDQGVISGINEFVAGMADVASIDPNAGGKVLCVIITDGLENASREVSPDALRAMISEREARGWTFIYLGANQDAWSTGTSYGLSGGVTGQTVTLDSDSSKSFQSALATTGKNHGAAYLSDQGSYQAMAASVSSRTISEDGVETASPGWQALGDATATLRPSNALDDALSKAKKEVQE